MALRRDPELEPAVVRAAVGRIPAELRASAQYIDETLSDRAGFPVVVKVETANPVRSFKGRGTWLALRELAAAGRIGPERPVVVASTGNFGQGTAYAGRALGVPVVVFADLHANPLKLARIRSLGARVVQSGDDFDEARAASEAYARGEEAFLLVDGQEPWVATGAATMALELTDAVRRGELPEPATAYVPVGNGALIVGVGGWLRLAAPACRVVGVQSEAAPSMTLSWRAKRPIETETARTMAEGIATRVPVPEALEMMEGRVDEMLLVSEEALADGQAELTAATGITVEASAAASWAGVLADPQRRGPAVVILTGSNVIARP